MGNQMREAVTFPEAVCLRPTMYTLGGTFEEVIAFLEGYHSGVATGNLYAPAVLWWQSFREWLALQLGVEQSEVFSSLRGLHASSGEALKDLTARIAHFRQQNPRN